MTLDKIRMFLAICEEGTASKAAVSLHVSQPAITQGIKDLEETLQVQLFDRVGRNLVLSQAGHKFLPYARKVVASYNEAYEVFIPSLQSIRVGATLTISSIFLARVIQDAKESLGINIEVTCANKSKIHELLEKNIIDVALVEGSVDLDTYHYYPLGEFHLDLVVAKDYYDSTKQEDYELVAREIGSTYRSLLDKYVQDHEMNPKVSWTCTDNLTVKDAVLHKHGLGLLPREIIYKELETKKLISVAKEDISLREPYGIVVNRIKTPSSALDNFIQFVNTNTEIG